MCDFFFQAEDGIRDIGVTEVQTCALPISDPGCKLLSADYSQIELRLAAHMADVPQLKEAFNAGADIHRSEERRVGKECRSPWALYHQKKKNENEVARRQQFEAHNDIKFSI